MGLRTKVYPWREVIADEGIVVRHYGSSTRLTSGQSMRQLRLAECLHLVERPVIAGRAAPKRVRCDECPTVSS